MVGYNDSAFDGTLVYAVSLSRLRKGRLAIAMGWPRAASRDCAGATLHSTDPILRPTGIPTREHVSETPPGGSRRFFNAVGGQGFTPFAQGWLRATMNRHSNQVMPVLTNPTAKVSMRRNPR
jgi:hypothetical protein